MHGGLAGGVGGFFGQLLLLVDSADAGDEFKKALAVVVRLDYVFRLAVPVGDAEHEAVLPLLLKAAVRRAPPDLMGGGIGF